MPRRFLIPALLPFLLAGCIHFEWVDDEDSSSSSPAPLAAPAASAAPAPQGCPAVSIVPELARVTDYGGAKPLPERRVASATLKNLAPRCEAVAKGTGVRLSVALEAEKGPRLGSDRISFPFFLAILDSSGTITAKELVTADFVFPEKADTAERTETFRVVLPGVTASAAGSWKILAGFQLTEDQLRQQQAEKPVP